MKRKEHGSDVCFCGDYRSQHSRVRWGTEGPADRCFCGCVGFRWGRPAKAEERAHWEKYHPKEILKKAQRGG